MSTSSTRKGVRLTLPGAPDTPHQVPGLFLTVQPHQITPLETDDDVARAQRLIDEGAPLEIVNADTAGEPWRGYDDKSADDITKRLERADTDLAAAVIAYEQANKNRSTVLEAAAARISTAEEA